jgi:hypothetical protein
MTELDLLHDESRVWIYQSDKKIDQDKIDDLNRKIANFSRQWTSHNHQLKAFGKLYYQRFLVLFVDETKAGASGCSIDKSVQFIRQLESELQVDFFNRQVFYFKDGDDIMGIHQWDIPKAYNANEITDKSLVFDSLVNTKKDFDQSWLKSFGESWHKRFI